MKKLALILILITILASCEYDTMHLQYEYASVHSTSLFVVNGKAYTSYGGNLPIAIYNPNNYAITVTADGIDYVIAPLATLELKEEGTDD